MHPNSTQLGKPNVIVDARSAVIPRLTGWERYARGVRSIVEGWPSIAIRAPEQRRMKRVIDDWIGLPIGTRRFDYVHFLTFPPALSFPKQRAIFTLMDLTYWKFPETTSFMGGHYYAPLSESAVRSNTVVTISESVSREIAERWPGVHARVVSPFVELEAVEPVAVSGFERPYVIAVGSIEPRKNLLRLAEAYTRSAVSSEVDLVVVGRRAWGTIPDGVRLTGPISDGELRFLMERAIALVSPSLYEGFGLPLAEAAHLGTPVVCSDIPVFREVTDGDAIFFDPLNADSIVDALEGAVENSPEPRTPVRRYPRSLAEAQLRELYEGLE